MNIKRIAALLLCFVLLLQTAAFADEETEDDRGALEILLSELDERLSGGEISLKNGAGESEEPPVYFRSDISKSKKTDPEIFRGDGLEPGGHLINGHVVYIKEDGTRARNETVNGRDYNIAGSYTTGDRDFDAMLAWVLVKSDAGKYDFGSEEQLHLLFKWEVNNMGYKKSEFIDPGTHGWELARGKALLLEGKGNCYMFAGLFYELSRAIGYEPIAYSGRISAERSPHGWVEIEIDGTVYIFDTEICYQQIYFKQNYDANLYMQTEEQLKGWMYVKMGDDVPPSEETPEA